MKNAIIVHGKANQAKYYDPSFASPSNACWLPWIQKQLLMRDILTQTPEMPNPWEPDYSAWSEEFERYSITPETILVGHSCGAGFIVRWLSEHKDTPVGHVVLVAPWTDPDRSGGTGTFFDFSFDSNLAERTEKIIIFYSDDDFPSARASRELIKKAIPNIGYKKFNKHGHFTEITEFLELSEELLSKART